MWGKKGPSYNVGRNVSWCSFYGKNKTMEVPQKTKKENYHIIQKFHFLRKIKLNPRDI